jgi:hypothetical protein
MLAVVNTIMKLGIQLKAVNISFSRRIFHGDSLELFVNIVSDYRLDDRDSIPPTEAEGFFF